MRRISLSMSVIVTTIFAVPSQAASFKDFEITEPSKLERVFDGIPSIRDRVLNYGLARGQLLHPNRLAVKNIECPYSCNFEWEIVGRNQGGEADIKGNYKGKADEGSTWFAITFGLY
jgi:hypothetical protein